MNSAYKSIILLIVSLLFMSNVRAKAGENTIEFVVNGKKVEWDLSSLQKKIAVVKVTVSDPVYKSQVTYDAFALSNVLTLAGINETSGDEIVFQSKDGYAPSAPYSVVKLNKGFLAFREHGTELPWRKIKQGKAWISPAPYYVVWAKSETKGKDETLPWPYQLVKIEAVQFAKKFDKLFPSWAPKESKEYRGFVTFKNQCIRCHSLNLQGGDLGPELNIPKNITEYWDAGTLRTFIHDAPSFRAKSKMPSFAGFTDTDLDEVLAYILSMKDHKIQ